MVAGIVGIFLFCLLLIVQLGYKREKQHCYLLNDNLPFPAAGQGSSIFSLTALFGCYLAIMHLLGVLALVGIAIGSLVGLTLIRRLFLHCNAKSFHAFLIDRFNPHVKTGMLFLSFIAFTQSIYAVSELLIMKEILKTGLGIEYRYSIIMVVGLGLIAYIYSIMDGYLAVFKTDIIQFVAILVMGILFFFLLFTPAFSYNHINLFGLKNDLWLFGKEMPLLFANSINIILGFFMGLGFVLASPDTWKRVFIATKTTNRFSFYYLIGAGFLPFILISPVFFVEKGNININSPIEFLMNIYDFSSPILISIIILGFISSFLSSFDSSLISTVHLLSVERLKDSTDKEYERTTYNYRLALAFLFVNFTLGVCLLLFQNPYIVANFLLCPFGIISGMLIGTNGFKRKLTSEFILLTIVISLCVWIIYLLTYIPNIFSTPTINQIGTIPLGVILSVSISILSFFKSKPSKCKNY